MDLIPSLFRLASLAKRFFFLGSSAVRQSRVFFFRCSACHAGSIKICTEKCEISQNSHISYVIFLLCTFCTFCTFSFQSANSAMSFFNDQPSLEPSGDPENFNFWGEQRHRLPVNLAERY